MSGYRATSTKMRTRMELDTEWLETDGRGGFASGTVGLLRTRRYHALLLASATPPTGRFVLVNGIEAWVSTSAGRTALTAQAYADGTIFPDGRDYLRDFRPVPFPSWFFVLPDGTAITFTLFCSRHEAETILRWTADRPVDLAVRPLFSGRDYHALHRENQSFAFGSNATAAGRTWEPYEGVPSISARGDFGWIEEPVWYRGFSYAQERARGLDDGEDLASPGIFTWASVREATLAFRAGSPGTRPLHAVEDAERARRSRPAYDVAADAYLADRQDGRTVLAGFPWFTDWGRDTFIAIRGLLITRGRLREAAAVLLAWSGCVCGGMLPNRFPDSGEQPEYNTVDAALWFAVAVHELLVAGGAEAEEAARLRGAVVAVLEGYESGTRYGIALDESDGLLRADAPGVQLTWMDAKVGDHVVTRRAGKPVEVQVLWINALLVAGQWPGGSRWRALADRARASFLAAFPDPATGGLIDVLDAPDVPDGRDRRVRPNQVLAAGGLPFEVVTPALRAGIVDLVERELLTPFGLRTLSSSDPDYHPRYAGGSAERDGAYHQGTAWPWLLGPFVAAWLAVRADRSGPAAS
ncbi:amylo-alpha-1,6-glucosidase, partial [Acidisphaera rubrifaciens]|uniref:amylo-alpha-1,6-glucosidase n=1 Tax=Acidisphaera rubrifaciens TaxID=50715 RepID=UPI0011DDE94E